MKEIKERLSLYRIALKDWIEHKPHTQTQFGFCWYFDNQLNVDFLFFHDYFIELFKYRTTERGGYFWRNREERIEALRKTIKDLEVYIIKSELSNQKRHDKGDLVRHIRFISPDFSATHNYLLSLKRQDLINILFELLENEDKSDKLAELFNTFKL